jgi:hypothetical protein
VLHLAGDFVHRAGQFLGRLCHRRDVAGRLF